MSDRLNLSVGLFFCRECGRSTECPGPWGFSFRGDELYHFVFLFIFLQSVAAQHSAAFDGWVGMCFSLLSYTSLVFLHAVYGWNGGALCKHLLLLFFFF